jgi:hypothetical protein
MKSLFLAGAALVATVACIQPPRPISVEGADAAPPPPVDASPTATPPVQVQQELMDRWNAVVDQQPPGDFDFHWRAYDQFPHPTFKGGSAEAYRAFAVALLAFLEARDDFDFLARNHLFRTPLVAATVSGQGNAVTTFAALAASLSSPDSFATVPEETRAPLAAYSAKIEAL